MSLFDFSSNAMALNFGLLAGAAVMIWIAGTKLEHAVAQLAILTGLGKAFFGLVLLSGATALPEMATTISASLAGNADMAVHNLLGSIIFQTAVLAVADLTLRHAALTHKSPRYVVLMEGVGLVFLLSAALMGMAVSHQVGSQFDRLTTNVIAGSFGALLLCCYVLMVYVTFRSQHRPRWLPTGQKEKPEPSQDDKMLEEEARRASPGRLVVGFLVASAVVLAAGWTLAQAGGALAEQTGLGGSFIGFTLLAMATSLPELSTAIAATRAGRIETAFSNIFGSNAFMVAMLVVVGLLVGSQAMMESLSVSAQFAAALGIFLTCIYLWGLLERADETVGRLGWDSAAVLLFVGLGNAVFYWLK